MKASPACWGYVLTGGRSARMGTNKALLPLQGKTVVEHIAGEMAAVVPQVVLVGLLPQKIRLPWPSIPDVQPGRGPVGGLVTALQHLQTEWLLVCACDMPGVTRQLFAALVNQASHSSAQCILAADNRVHPLCAVYHRSTLAVFRQALEAEQPRMQDVIAKLNVERLPVSDPKLLFNINTPEDWVVFQAHA